MQCFFRKDEVVAVQWHDTGLEISELVVGDRTIRLHYQFVYDASVCTLIEDDFSMVFLNDGSVARDGDWFVLVDTVLIVMSESLFNLLMRSEVEHG